MAFTPIRRRRRRRTALIVVVVLAVIAGAGYAVTRLQSEQQIRREYLDVAFEVADGQHDAAARFSDMVIRLDELSRPAVVGLLEELEELVIDLSRRLESADPPSGRFERAHVFFAVAAQEWKDGIIATRSGIETLSQSPLDPDGLATLSVGLVALRVGDASYADFSEVMLELEAAELGREFPGVAFVPSESELLFEAPDIARRIFLTPDLGVVRNLAVADVKLEPGPVGTEEGVPVVPLSESLDVEVTISNRGTIAEESITVQLDVVSSDGSQVTFDQDIDVIEPGALSSVVFEDIPADPGGLYEAVAGLPDEDDDPSDDTRSLVFIRDDAS